MELLNSFSLDVLVAFGYGELTKGMDSEQKADIDKQLDALDEKQGPVVEKETSDGQVVHISEARLARMRANRQAMAGKPQKGQEVSR